MEGKRHGRVEEEAIRKREREMKGEEEEEEAYLSVVPLLTVSHDLEVALTRTKKKSVENGSTHCIGSTFHRQLLISVPFCPI